MSSIRSILDKLAFDAMFYGQNPEGNSKPTIDQALKEISELIDEAKPNRITNYADINPPFDGQTDLSYLKGRARGHNLAVDQYQSNLKEALK